MGFLSRLFGGGRGGERPAPDGGVYVYLRCEGLPRRPCGEPIRVRIDPRHDLEEEYEEGAEDRLAGYTLHKEVLGNRCPNMMRLTIHYDERKRETGRQAAGATLIHAEEYARLRAAEERGG